MTAARLSRPALSITRRLADFAEKRATSIVASSPVSLLKVMRRCSAPAIEPFSVSDAVTVQAARAEIARSRTRTAASEVLPAMFLQHGREPRILRNQIPERADFHCRDGNLCLPRQKTIDDLEGFVVFTHEHVNLPEGLRRNGSVECIDALRQ